MAIWKFNYEIHLANGRWAKILDIKFKGLGEVFNFSVAGNNNYYVGNSRLLTHNARCQPIWTSTSSRSGVENAFEHWKKHKSEFPEFNNAKEYVEGTKDFLNSPSTGKLTKSRANGDTLYYDSTTNTFGVKTASGVPKTMFRPKRGINYWNEQ